MLVAYGERQPLTHLLSIFRKAVSMLDGITFSKTEISKNCSFQSKYQNIHLKSVCTWIVKLLEFMNHSISNNNWIADFYANSYLHDYKKKNRSSVKNCLPIIIESINTRYNTSDVLCNFPQHVHFPNFPRMPKNPPTIASISFFALRRFLHSEGFNYANIFENIKTGQLLAMKPQSKAKQRSWWGRFID